MCSLRSERISIVWDSSNAALGGLTPLTCFLGSSSSFSVQQIHSDTLFCDIDRSVIVLCSYFEHIVVCFTVTEFYSSLISSESFFLSYPLFMVEYCPNFELGYALTLFSLLFSAIYVRFFIFLVLHCLYLILGTVWLLFISLLHPFFSLLSSYFLNVILGIWKILQHCLRRNQDSVKPSDAQQTSPKVGNRTEIFMPFSNLLYVEGYDVTEDMSCDIPSSNTAYKRVDKKVKPVPGVHPEEAKGTYQIPRDPLLTMPALSPHPPDFIPTEKLTQERIDSLNLNPDGFLWPEEMKLFLHILKLNEKALAFSDEDRGTLSREYFSDYIIPVVPHVPWLEKNIPIPPGIKDRVISILRDKMASGLYEPSQSSYRSKYFCVLKKNGNLRIVHDLQPLNKVTIRDAGGPPLLDDFVEPYAGCKCYSVFDLFSGFDARVIHAQSRDMTSFLTPLGLLRLTAMPQGFTNSPAEFQRCMSFVLQNEIPHIANIFIDDAAVKGPKTEYLDKNGLPEVLKENPGIRRYVWEHSHDAHRVLHCIKESGATCSAKKIQLCRREVIILGQKCTPEGRVPEDVKVDKIRNWPVLRTAKDVRGFLGLCGTVRIWIKDYSKIARPLTELIRKDAPFVWTEERQSAFDKLKQLVSSAPALKPIDYATDRPVFISVDSSYIAVGFILSQLDESNKRVPARYGSLPFNERESRYSQPKLELYGVYRALRHWRLFLFNIRRLILEVDAKYIKEMLNNPDLQPNATINRWIQGILLFDFELQHVPADKHRGPDALSRKEPTEEDWNEVKEWEHDEAITEELLDCRTYLFQVVSSQAVSTLPSYAARLSKQEKNLRDIRRYLLTLETPSFRKDLKLKRRFLQKAAHFFMRGSLMFKKRSNRTPLLVIFDLEKRQSIMQHAHEKLGHRGVYGVFYHLRDRFFWPHLYQDVKHHVSSCHECQLWSTKKVEVSPTIRIPATIFSKIYVDILFMPNVRGYKYIAAARDDLSHAAEGRELRKASSKHMSRFFLEQIICRYGHIAEVVTDNGPEVSKAFHKLLKRYGIPQIKISPYNKHANGVVEQGHFTIRESILKDCKGNIKKWPERVHLAFFADRVTTRRVTGFSPFYLLHGVDPVLPFDLTEATFMISGYRAGLTSAELLALRIRQLDKRPEDIQRAAEAVKRSRIASKAQFEKRFRHRILKMPIEPGQLVLVRNSERDGPMPDKYSPRYLGPYIVDRRTKGGSYVLKELDGTFIRRAVAAMRLLPYKPRVPKHLQSEEISDESGSDSSDSSASTEDSEPEDDPEWLPDRR